MSKDTSHPVFNSLAVDQVLEPVITDPIIGDEAKGFVANVYRNYGDELPDFRSQDFANLFLLSRGNGVADPGPKTNVKVANRNDKSNPENAADVRSNKRRWIFSLGLSMLSLVGFNIAVNAPTIGRDVAGILNTTTKTSQPGAVKSQSKDRNLSFKIGESEGSMTPPHASISSLVKVLRLSTEKIVSISVTGNTSPEYGNNAQTTLHSNPANRYLGFQRADQVLADIKKLDPALSDVPTRVKQVDHILTINQYNSLENLARENGYSSFLDALHDVQDGIHKSKALTNAINHYFINASIRGVDVKVSLRPKTSAGKKGNQPDTHFEFVPYFIPILPLRRKKASQNALHKQLFIGSYPVFREKITPISSETSEWVALGNNELSQYKEGDIVESNPWALTRKYAITLRELKLSNVLNMEYHDGFNADVKAKILFLENQPSELLQSTLQTIFSRAVDYTKGSIGRQVKTISILRKHENVHYENRLAFLELGIDQNLPNATVAHYPTLELLEVLLPDQMDEEHVLKENGGPIWKLAECLAQISLNHNQFLPQSIEISGRHSENSDIMYLPQSKNEMLGIFTPEDQEKIDIAKLLALTSWLSGIEYTDEQRNFIDSTFVHIKEKYGEASIRYLLDKFRIPETVPSIDITYSMKEAKDDPQIRTLIVHSQVGKIALGGLNSWQLIPRSTL